MSMTYENSKCKHCGRFIRRPIDGEGTALEPWRHNATYLDCDSPTPLPEPTIPTDRLIAVVVGLQPQLSAMVGRVGLEDQLVLARIIDAAEAVRND